ncbi:hypothetical protein CO614_06910 [Lysobacteraceae bacterium NML120232]|nr:hypothetical protein CO608_07615 [Xanthomonadaceae bacterium NML08-0793]PJK11680.1 hypothetical protein CO614_06910 [Xanthomonadaceae bacterium NML120232]
MSRARQTAGSSRAAHSQAQRERILSAAEHCFTEHGFHAASMAQIAKTADISTGLIYRYFSSKSELIHGIVERQMQCFAEDIQTFERDNSAPAAQVMQVMRGEHQLRPCGTRSHLEPALVLEISAESGRDRLIAEALARFNQQIDQAISDWMARPKAEGGFAVPAHKLPQRSMALRALLDGLKQRQVREPDMDMAAVEAMLQDVLPLLMGE